MQTVRHHYIMPLNVVTMISHGATVDMKIVFSDYTFKSYSMNSTCLNVIVSFQYNMTPLHYASKHEVVQVLLSHGATVDIV